VTADLVLVERRPLSLPEKIEYAVKLADANMLPSQYRNQPANILWAIEYAETLRITAMAAILGIHVIDNKPGASAALISGLVRAAGHKLRVSGNAEKAVAQIVRSDDPEFPFEVVYPANWALWSCPRRDHDIPNEPPDPSCLSPSR